MQLSFTGSIGSIDGEVLCIRLKQQNGGRRQEEVSFPITPVQARGFRYGEKITLQLTKQKERVVEEDV